MDRSEMLQALVQEKAAIMQGDAERIAAQHTAGKSTARERVAHLFDAGSFVEMNALQADSNCVAGSGTVNGRAVYCFAQDYTSCGGAMTLAQTEKILKLLDQAQMNGAPVVALLDSAGMKLQESAKALPAAAAILTKLARLSGVCPLICAVMGPCTGLSALMPALCDVTVQVKKTGEIALHTALVMNTEKGVEKKGEALFGADTMAAQGVCSLTAENEDDALALIGEVLDYLPGSNLEDAPMTDGEDLNRTLVCEDAENVAALMSDLADDAQVLELNKQQGKAVHTALCRIGGRTCGIVATDYAVENGRLCACACKKAARFIRLCDCYQLPVITLLNTDGMAVPPVEKQGCFIKASADLCYAYAEATTPKLCVVTGHAVGTAYAVMGGHAVSDVVYAWPEAMIAPLTPETAVQTLDGDKLNAGESREALEVAYEASCGALASAKLGLADDVIEKRETRKYLIAAMELLSSKHDVNPAKKHGNLPL